METKFPVCLQPGPNPRQEKGNHPKGFPFLDGRFVSSGNLETNSLPKVGGLFPLPGVCPAFGDHRFIPTDEDPLAPAPAPFFAGSACTEENG